MTSTLQPAVPAEVHQPWAGKGFSASIMNSSPVPNTSESFDGAPVPVNVSSININDEAIPLEPAAFHCTACVQQPRQQESDQHEENV